MLGQVKKTGKLIPVLLFSVPKHSCSEELRR